LSVTGKDFLEFADRCVAQGDEIGYRNAVGRAYYGVYHEISGTLEKAVFNHTHQTIRDYLIKDAWLKGNEPFDKMKLISLGSRLKLMHTQRVSADYNIGMDVSEADAKAAVIQAQKFMELLKEMVEQVYPKNPAA